MAERQGKVLHGLSIRPVCEGDLASSVKFNEEAGWTDTAEDTRRLMRCEPQGFLIAELQGKPVGQIFSISYDKSGWIGFLVVLRKLRRQGIGSALIRKGIAYLKDSNVQTISLEARPEYVSFYEQMGFESEFKTWKFRCVNKRASMVDKSNEHLMHNSDLREVSDLDSNLFSGDRSRVLEGILADNPDSCYVARYEGKLKGYVMCRPTRTGFRIGPWICDSQAPVTAQALLVSAMNSIPLGANISLSAPGTSKAGLSLLSKYGFERLTPNVRMSAGEKYDSTRALGIFILGGLEKG